MFFGYTHCPDICPRRSSIWPKSEKTRQRRGARAGLFVTVDPERDTRECSRNTCPRSTGISGLSGDAAATQRVAQNSDLLRKRPGSTPTAYTVDHSAQSYVIARRPLRLFVRHERIAQDLPTFACPAQDERLSEIM